MDDDNNVKEPKCNYYVDSTLQDSLEWWKKVICTIDYISYREMIPIKVLNDKNYDIKKSCLNLCKDYCMKN